MKTINDVCFKGKRVIVRVDFNVPLDENFQVLDNTRIVSSLPTIKKIISDGGKAIIISHLGRPQNKYEDRFSLKHLLPELKNLLSVNISFSKDCIGDNAVKKTTVIKNGEVLILENLRFHSAEKEGDLVFAEELSKLGDAYVNDAFGCAHRKHASTSIIASFFPRNKYFGLLMSKEITTLEKTLFSPKKPFTAIIGGAKITGKIEVIKSLLERVDNLIIGGAMAYTFIKSLNGKVGKSLVENSKIKIANSLIKLAKEKKKTIMLPVDSVNAKNITSDCIITSDIYKIDADLIGLDIGVKSCNIFSKIITDSKTIIWNGPMGLFEIDKFENGTKKIAESICNATKNGAFSIVGGGDSVSAIKKFNYEKNISYISTGGGAMLDYLEGKVLPGVFAIQN
jgi:phosphoglycerate kinase